MQVRVRYRSTNRDEAKEVLIESQSELAATIDVRKKFNDIDYIVDVKEITP